MRKITVKLYATLSEFLPVGAVKNAGVLEVEENATVSAVIEQLRLPAEQVHLVLINGSYIEPESRPQTLLKDADTLAIWPPVAGG